MSRSQRQERPTERAARAFHYLQRTHAGVPEGDRELVGRSGTLIIPFGESGNGKVLLADAGRTVELIARPYSSTDRAPAEWGKVVIVAMDGSTALVAPLDSLMQGEQN